MRGLFVEFVRPGQSDPSGKALWRTSQVVVSLVLALTNVIGACSVLAIAYFVVPLPTVEDTGHVRLVNAVAAAIYVAVAVRSARSSGSVARDRCGSGWSRSASRRPRSSARFCTRRFACR